MTSGVLPTASPADVRPRAARLLRPRAVGVAMVVGLTGASTAATLAGPALIGVVVDAATGGGDRRTIDRAALAYAGLALAGALLRYLAEVRAAVVGESALAELRTEVFDHALDAPIDVIERAGTGELVARVTADVTVLAKAMRMTVPRVSFALVELVLTVVALVLVDPRLAAAAIIVAIPVAGLAGRWYFLNAPARYRAERERHAELGSMLLESYRGRATLAAHRATTRRRTDLARRGRAVVDAELSSTSARNRFRPAISISQAMSLVVVVALGTKYVADGTATVGAVSAAALYLVRMFDPVAALLEEADEVQQATASLARLVGVTQLPGERGSHGGSVTSGGSPDVGSGGIDIDVAGVDFAYQTGGPVLVSVDLAVGAGERVVVVGPSGAGKTTLAKLVAGTHRPDRGVVRLGGVPVDDLHPTTRSRVVAMVAQEGHTFGRTVADNVRLGRLDASLAQVRAALEAVDALVWVDALPHGVETRLGPDHHHLSPPEHQQLGLARLVCGDPAVVVLDEATADLDPAAAARTERHLAAALAGRTVLVIAHRLDVAASADRVLVLDHGRVVASGTHRQLLEDGGLYAELWGHWIADRGLDDQGVSEG